MVARLKEKKTKKSLKKDKKKGRSSQAKATPKTKAKAKTKANTKAKPKAKTSTKLRAQTKAKSKSQAKTKGQAKPRPKAKTKHRIQTQVESEPETSTQAHPEVPDNIDDILAEFRGHIETSEEDRVRQEEKEIDEYLEQYQQGGGQGSLATESDDPDTVGDLLAELKGTASEGTTIESSALESEASSQSEVQENIDDILAEFNAPASEVPTVPSAQEFQETASLNMTERVDEMIAEFQSSASRETSEPSPHDSQEAPASIDDILAEFDAPAPEAPTAPPAQELQEASGPDMAEKVDKMIAEFRSSASRETSEPSPHDSQEAPASIDDILAEFGASAPEKPALPSAPESKETSHSAVSERMVTGFQAPAGEQTTAATARSSERVHGSGVPTPGSADATEAGRQLYTAARDYVLRSIKQVEGGQGPDVKRGASLVRDLANSIDREVTLLLEATDRRQDFSVSAHSVNVSVLALCLMGTLQRDLEERIKLGLAGLLHEIGVVRLPKGSMYRTAPPDPELYRRAVYSAQILKKLCPDEQWLYETVGQVFEREDGRGFPEELTGENIREEAKILAVGDSFEDCIHDRPYRKALTGYQAVFELTAQKSGSFSEHAVKALLKTVSLYPYNEYVMLNTGEIGTVVNINQDNMVRPTVRVLYDAEGRLFKQQRVLDLSLNPSVSIRRALTIDDLPATG